MHPRCWLPRRSKQLEHNQSRGLSILRTSRVAHIRLPRLTINEAPHGSFRQLTERSALKEQLEKLVLAMYRSGKRYAEAVDEFHKAFLLTVLRENRGNQVKAARELGVHRNTLSRMAQTLGVDTRQLRPARNRPPAKVPNGVGTRKRSVA